MSFRSNTEAKQRKAAVMAKADKGAGKQEDDFDLGFGGLFKGLGDFLEVLSDKMEAFEQPGTAGARPRGAPRGAPPTRTGHFKVKGMGDQVQGVYGLSFRTVANGVPHVEHFGNIRHTDEGPVVADVREPLVDVFDEPDEIVLVAEMPGANEEDISVELHDDVLVLETSGERRYAREVLLPAAVDAASMQRTFRNGILELKLKKIME